MDGCEGGVRWAKKASLYSRTKKEFVSLRLKNRRAATLKDGGNFLVLLLANQKESL